MKGEFVTIYSTDEEVADYAETLGRLAERIMTQIKAGDHKQLELWKDIGTLIGSCSCLANTLPARVQFLKQQRQEVRDLAELRASQRRDAIRAEPGRE